MRLPLGKWVSCLSLLTASCHSADVNDRDASLPPSSKQTAEKEKSVQSSWIRKGWWRACRSDADCEKDHACVAVDRRPEQATLLAAFLEPKACALVMPLNSALQDASDFERGYLERLLLFPKVRVTLSLLTCTAKACRYLNGAPVDCCNRCDGEHVWLSGFAGISLVHPDGTRLECMEHMDCEPPSCPAGVELDKDLEIAGAFHIVDGRLTFVLATVPERWSEPF